MFTIARSAVVSSLARRNWKKQSGQEGLEDPPVLKALQNELPGDPDAAREVYRL